MADPEKNNEEQANNASKVAAVVSDAISQIADQLEAQGIPRGALLVGVMTGAAATLTLSASEAMRRQRHLADPNFTRAGASMASFVKDGIRFFVEHNVVNVQCDDPTCDCMSKRPAWGAKLVEAFGVPIARAIEDVFAASEMAPSLGEPVRAGEA